MGKQGWASIRNFGEEWSGQGVVEQVATVTGLLVLQSPQRRAAWAQEEVAAWRQWPWLPL